MKDRDALDAVRTAAQWFPALSAGAAERSTDVMATLLDLIGDARLVRSERPRMGPMSFTIRAAPIAEDEYFFAEQNARLVRNAEMYYRAMFAGQVESWNLRDTHMMETLEALMAWTTRRSVYARMVLWAHNSHLGDARATQMGTWGQLNLGQLARDRQGDQVFLIGFTTHTGTVTAAREWDQPADRRRVTPIDVRKL